MKLKLVIPTLFFVLSGATANADYLSEKNRYEEIKNKFGICIATTLKKSGDDSTDTIYNCYSSAQNALTEQIKAIRLQKKIAMNEAEWKSINLNHQRGVQSCTEISESVPYSNITGYLDIQCEANFYFSLAESAIAMHYIKPSSK